MSELSAESPTPDAPAPLRSVHTTSFARILSEAPASVLVTTYQAGKLVVLRNDRGVLNTHFRNFVRPMGLATSREKLGIGISTEVWEFQNVPAVCSRLDSQMRSSQGDSLAGDVGGSSDGGPSGTSKHDVCFLPRRSHTTGDVQIHEMAWVGDELWFVNTAFSCLAVRSDVNSFDLRWLPPFITHLMPDDRCHLNGLAVRDGIVRYVTALGASNEPGGWRANKRSGGVVIDVESNEVMSEGLSMPHSPRWHRQQLWILESGQGSVGIVDVATGKYEAIAHLPGFTRGLSFLGNLAFIGLSQVRESGTFGGLPLTERLDQRTSGVWVVNIDTGQIEAFVRFEDALQEIFAVEVLCGVRFPEIVNHDADLIASSYVLGHDALKLVPKAMRPAPRE
jgi:uncharacterized protein (TIGR03032 family)